VRGSCEARPAHDSPLPWPKTLPLPRGACLMPAGPSRLPQAVVRPRVPSVVPRRPVADENARFPIPVAPGPQLSVSLIGQPCAGLPEELPAVRVDPKACGVPRTRLQDRRRPSIHCRIVDCRLSKTLFRRSADAERKQPVAVRFILTPGWPFFPGENRPRVMVFRVAILRGDKSAI
jgi:hypothetical protein